MASKPRKTYPVESLKTRVNNMIRCSENRDERISLSMLLEDVLMETGNYSGFQYIAEDGAYVAYPRIQEGTYDPTRRRYY